MDEKMQLKDLCSYCFDTILASLQNNEKNKPSFPREFTGKSFPLFVTWYKKESGNNELRGCIGTFKSGVLDELVGKYALISAFEDNRFSKIKLKEVPLLSCSVSLLTNFEEAKNPFDWEIGVHGIQIQFTANGRSHGGTFLPEVAKEQNWDHKITIAYLVQKAGYRGSVNDVLDLIKMTRYQSSKVCISFEDYKQFRGDHPLLNFSI